MICALLSLALTAFLLAGCGRGTVKKEASETTLSWGFNTAAETEWSEDMLYEDLYKAFSAYETSVTLHYDCTDVLFDVYRQMIGDHPELFWLPSGGRYSKSTGPDGTSVVFTPEIMISKDEIQRRESELDAAVQEILAGTEAYPTPYEKLLYLHNVLVERTEYDSVSAAGGTSEALAVSSCAYGCLVNRTAVCSGYAAAFQLLAEKIGVTCRRLHGTDGRSGVPHEWNLVQLDGDWYHVDVTWDDAVFAGAGNLPNARFYDYFCVTDEEVTRTHAIEEGQDLPQCTATKYNYFVVQGLTLPAYTYEEAARLIEEQVNEEQITIKFPSKSDAAAAAEDLIQSQRIFEIPAVRSVSPTSVSYTVTDPGTLMIWLLP